MAENSKIEWTDHTFNPWVGCTKVSPACDHCYAETWAKRTGHQELWVDTRRRTTAANWRLPLRWNAEAEACFPQLLRPRVFCASLADVFDNAVPESWRADLWDLVQRTRALDWLLLTKRIGNAARMLPWSGYGDPWENVWLGATVVTQEELDRDLPKLLWLPARVRFLSCEPLLGPISFARWPTSPGLHWVICGGESGAGARPLELRWAADLRRECESRGIAFFMKQGSQANWPDFKHFEGFPPSVRIRDFPDPSARRMRCAS